MEKWQLKHLKLKILNDNDKIILILLNNENIKIQYLYLIGVDFSSDDCQ